MDLKTLLSTIVAYLNEAGDFAGTLDPALIPLVAIGKAVDSQIPGLAAAVQGWIQGNAPTQAEIDDVLAKLAVLGNPNNP
jgi:hypothetical protein